MLSDHLSWVKGTHNVKVGFEVRWTRLNFGNPTGCGGFNFSGSRTGFPNNSGLDPAIPRDQQAIASGDSFASFLLGAADGAGTGVNYAEALAPRWHYYSGFVQDDIKLRRNFTLNVGLRWDYWTPLLDKFDNYSMMDPALPNPGSPGFLGAMSFAGEGPGRIGRRQLTKGFGRNNVSPHLGFAWTARPNLVVRAGAGMQYFPSAPYGTGNVRGYTQGFSTSIGVGAPDPWTPGFYWDMPFTLAAPPPTLAPDILNAQGVTMWGDTAHLLSYMQTWNINIQHSFAKNWMIDVGYVGNKGNRLESGMVNAKQLDPRFLSLRDLLLKPIDDPEVVARLDRSEGSTTEHVDPRTPMEKLVGGIWLEALGAERVSVRDNFFDLGGHSLLSMRVLARVEKAIGRRLNPRDLIFQTLEQFAAMCERQGAAITGGGA
jgi:hypothetical protein